MVKPPDGDVRVVDEDELDAAIEASDVSGDLAEKAVAVAERLADAL